MAHLDHPGFWIEDVDGARVHLAFRGGVSLKHAVRGSKLEFFRRGQPGPTGRGVLERASGAGGRLQAARAKLVSGTAEPGGFAMWRFPGFSLRKGKVVARCCDDLLGAAAALCVLDELSRGKRRDTALWALFTRAEEVGFLGSLWAVHERLLPKDARVLSLECSRALPHAPQGGGVIVRVGDRASLFDAPLTEALRQACERLKKDDPSFRYQRRLMDGGACEATAFCAAGYRASGLALPLGNYHNQAGLDGGKKGIGAEHVAAADFAAEVRLLLALAREGRGWSELEGATKRRMAELTREALRELKAQPLRRPIVPARPPQASRSAASRRRRS
ncbi:MAG: M20/M25/M40 family metallo-hydrolase [Planctomycetota bacterium]|nr:M20/M25/M40 family metallo-hydrolase [Planctomycetota bacterium]